MSSHPFLYLVRCSFTGGEAAEQAWNDWYSGPKMQDMLAMPMFLDGHRYKCDQQSPDAAYLAVWQLESPEAFESERYHRRWGFADWADRITDWSRDLVEPVEVPEHARFPGVAPVTMTGFASPDVDHALLPDAIWCRAAGLDLSWAWVAIEAAEDGAEPDPGSAEVQRLAGWRATYESLPDGAKA